MVPDEHTLISGVREGILVDTLVTLDQVDALAEWVKRFDKRVTGVYITHGHEDHWIGLARIQEHLPEARGLTVPSVLQQEDGDQLPRGRGPCGVPELGPGSLTSGDRGLGMIPTCRCGCCT